MDKVARAPATPLCATPRSRSRVMLEALWFGVLIAAALGGCATGPPRRGTSAPPLAEAGWIAVPDLVYVPQEGRGDCGAAALAMVLGRWGLNVDPAAMLTRTGPIDEKAGLQFAQLRSIVRAEGLKSFLIVGTFEDLVYEVERGRPVIVGVLRRVNTRGFQHYAVVTAVNRQTRRVLTADPADGWQRQDWKDFEVLWRFSRNLALVAWP